MDIGSGVEAGSAYKISEFVMVSKTVFILWVLYSFEFVDIRVVSSLGLDQ